MIAPEFCVLKFGADRWIPAYRMKFINEIPIYQPLGPICQTLARAIDLIAAQPVAPESAP